jgi:cytohesin
LIQGQEAEGGLMGGGLLDAVIRAARGGDVAALAALVEAHGPEAIRLDGDPAELTALHHAAAGGHAAAVEYLLSPAVAADPRAARDNDFTPLHAAAMFGHTEACAALLAAGAVVNAQTSPQKYAPLHSAAFAGHVATIRLLLDHGADPRLLNYRGEAPADTARRQGQAEAETILRAAAGA